MDFICYGDDGIHEPYCCKLSPNNSLSADSFLEIRYEGASVCLKVDVNSTVSESDIIVPSWVLFTLNLVGDGLPVLCTPIVKYESISGAELELNLEYCGHVDIKHWDESDPYSPGCINKSLPQLAGSIPLIMEKILIKHCEQILIKNESWLGFLIQKCLLLFVIKRDNSLLPAQASKETKFMLLIPSFETPQGRDPHVIEDFVVSSPSTSCLGLVAWEKMIQRILISMDVDALREFRSTSILVTGPEGSGKSSLALLVCQQLESSTSLNFKAGVISLLSAKKNFAKSLPPFNQIDSLTILELVQLLHAVSGSGWKVAQRDRERCNITLLVIDDLDVIFGHDDINNEDSNVMDVGTVGSEVVMYLSYALAKLLILCRHQNAQDQDQVYVLGTCRRSSSSIPRSCLGYPEFDMVLNMPRIQFEDRFSIIHSELQKFPFQYENLMLRDELVDELKTLNDIFIENNSCKWSFSLARMTTGYLPGDLITLVKRILYLHGGLSATNTNESWDIKWDSALSALSHFVPSSLRNVLGVTSVNGDSASVKWSDFGGFATTKQHLSRLLSGNFGTRTNRINESFQVFQGNCGIVLHGPSGCGKTYLAKIIASEAAMNFISIKATELLSKYFGQTEATIRHIFEQARSTSPCLLLIDDFDVIAHKRAGEDHDDLNSRVLSTFLNELDGLTGDKQNKEGGILVVVTCSSLSLLDEALIRPGRLSQHFHLTLPSEEDVKDILRIKLNTIPHSPELTADSVFDYLNLSNVQLSGSDVGVICRRAIEKAMHESIQAEPDSTAKFEISLRHFSL